MARKIVEVKSVSPEDIKYLNVPFILESTKQDEDSGVFKYRGYGSTFDNVDLVQDRVIKGAFLNTIDTWKKSGRELPALWQHDNTMPIGVYKSLMEDELGLFVEGELPMEDTFVSGRVVPQMKIGSVRSMSIGYYLWKYAIDEESGVWDLLEIELTEISLVTRPANPQARLTSFDKTVQIPDLEALSERELEKILREGVSFSRKDAKKLVSLLCKPGRDDLNLTERDAKDISDKIKQALKF